MEAQSQGECVPELELTKNLLQIRSSEVAQRADGHSSGTDGGGANTPRYFPLCVPTGGLHHVTFPPSMGDLRTERVPRKGLLTEPATDGLTLKNTTRQGHTTCYLCLTHFPQSLLDAHVSQDHLQVAEVREHLTQSTGQTREPHSILPVPGSQETKRSKHSPLARGPSFCSTTATVPTRAAGHACSPPFAKTGRCR